MASNGHTNISGSSNPAYEMVKHIMIDIENEEPQDLNTRWCSIYRVPSNLRSLNESAYTPQLVSIGPLHYGREKFNPVQKQKLRYLNLFRCRVENMDQFKEYLTRKEADIRQCYAEKLRDDIDKEKLVEMMLLDSVFIMELFLRVQREKSEEEDNRNGKNCEKHTYSDDIIVKQSWLNKSIQRDLLLLENQIPLFILQELYNIVPATDPDKSRPSFIELAHDYFNCYHNYKKADSCSYQKTAASSSSNVKSSKDNNTTSAAPGFEKKSSSRFMELTKNWVNFCVPQHFTDLIRSFYLCKHLKEFKKGSPLKTATKLQEVGVIFEKVDNWPLLDIKFRLSKICSWFLCLGCIPNFKMVEARLEIPQLRIDNTTECVLSNIMALEQFHYPNQPYVCSYVSLFASLIHTKEDVSLLVEKEVIEHTLRSDTEVETLVHGLGRNVETNKTCYKDMIDDLHSYYKRMWWNRSMVEIRLVYFRDLWRASSTIIGLFVFMFTILNVYQTIRGFYVVKH